MFTTHKNKQEFNDWWKQQDHKQHTRADMVLHTLIKAQFYKTPNLEASALLRAFKKHKINGYKAVLNSLEEIKYAIKVPRYRYQFNTFKNEVILAEWLDETVQKATSKIEDVINQIRVMEQNHVSC